MTLQLEEPLRSGETPTIQGVHHEDSGVDLHGRFTPYFLFASGYFANLRVEFFDSSFCIT